MRLALSVSVAALLLAACSAGGDGGQKPVVPTATLPTLTAAPLEWPARVWEPRQEKGFEDLNATLAADASTCVAVVRDGVLVHEASCAGTRPRTAVPVYSITKSVVGLLVAIAVGDGDLALDTKIAKHVPAWRGTASADVTVRDVMANVSGRRWTWEQDARMIRSEPDKTAFAVGVGQDVPPGERWEYDNTAIQVLEAVLSDATGRDVLELARERLLDPLGMRDTTWDRDAAGNPTTYSGMRSTCRDLARLGLLVARDGVWRDEQLVPTGVLDELVGSSSSDLNAAYGLLWWVNREGRVRTIERAAGFAQDAPPREGRLAPDVPADTTWALGYGNQYVAAVPSQDVVAVRLGRRPASPDRLTFASFTGAVLAAVRD